MNFFFKNLKFFFIKKNHPTRHIHVTSRKTFIAKWHGNKKIKQDCSYQGEALNVPTAHSRFWSSKIIKKLKVKKQNEFFFQKFEIFFYKKKSPHTPYKVQKDRFRYL